MSNSPRPDILAAIFERAMCDPGLARAIVALAAAYDLGRRNDLCEVAAAAPATLASLSPVLAPVVRAAVFADVPMPPIGETALYATPTPDLLRVGARFFEVTAPLLLDPRLSERLSHDMLLMSKGVPTVLSAVPIHGSRAARKKRVKELRDELLPSIHAITILVAHYIAGRDGGGWLARHEALFPGLHLEVQRQRLNRDVPRADRDAARAAGLAEAAGQPEPTGSAIVMAAIREWLTPAGLADLARARLGAAAGTMFDAA